MSARRATVADVDALVRLRARMFVDMGLAGDDAAWQAGAADWFAVHLVRPDCGVFVVDDPELGVVGSAVGTWADGIPGPRNHTGRRGHLFNVSTDPRCRRRGHARVCVEALVAWFDDNDVTVVELAATDDGVDLYRSLGFSASRFPALRRRLPTGRPGSAAAPAGR
ncbi:MAG TPA: GNAT family N-acetyltransferase [Pseudonocardiaceae bacterium]|nr:GNAT family N-acetyltransferase [Pseudonocardiaceae bacterium]